MFLWLTINRTRQVSSVCDTDGGLLSKIIDSFNENGHNVGSINEDIRSWMSFILSSPLLSSLCAVLYVSEMVKILGAGLGVYMIDHSHSYKSGFWDINPHHSLVVLLWARVY